MTEYSSFADDFYININLNTEMELPKSRDTLLHFFERMQKSYPEMTNFYTRENGDFVLEEDKEKGHYRWVSLENRRLCSGCVNPARSEDAYEQHELVLELAPYHLSVSTLDCEALDVLFGFDFTYGGNHDEIVAEALGITKAVEGILELPGARVINYEPSATIALDENCRLQCRLSIETRTNAYQIRTGDFHDDQLSVYFTIRQYWGFGPRTTFIESFAKQRKVGEELVESHVLPNVVRPLAQAISAK
jgi:hypothetical protein